MLSNEAREARSEYQRKYRETHKKEISKYQRKYRETHKKEISARNKAWREANKDHIKSYQETYWQRKAQEAPNNPDQAE